MFKTTFSLEYKSWPSSREVCQSPGNDDIARKHLRAQQIMIFIGGYKLQDSIEDKEDKFMKNVNWHNFFPSWQGFLKVILQYKYALLLKINKSAKIIQYMFL